MKISLTDMAGFKDIIRTISGLVNEGTFKVSKEEGLSFIALDPANVGLIALKMKPTEFSEWDTEDTTFSINIDKLKQMLQRGKGSMSLSVADNKLTIVMQDKTRKEFSMGLLDLEEKEQKEPNLEYDNTINIENAVLKDAIEDAAIMEESCTFTVKDGKFSIQGKGDTGSSDSEAIAVPGATDAVAKYSIEYLNKILASGVSKIVKVQFKISYPLTVEFSNKGTTMKAILAPRIEQ